MNTRPTTKAELLGAAEREYTALRATLDGLDARQLTEVWLGAWSVKDIVAHISGWHRELGPALERITRTLCVPRRRSHLSGSRQGRPRGKSST